MNRLIITTEALRNYKQISKSVTKAILEQYIRDAQIQDLAPLLGERLFNDIVLNPEKHVDLLNGGEYDINGITYYNVGLNTVLVHYSYSRYLLFGNMVDTPYSMVEKLNPGNSQPISYKQKEALHKENQDTAFTYFGSVRKYLERTKYPMYEINKCESRQSKFRIYKVV